MLVHERELEECTSKTNENFQKGETGYFPIQVGYTKAQP